MVYPFFRKAFDDALKNEPRLQLEKNWAEGDWRARFIHHNIVENRFNMAKLFAVALVGLTDVSGKQVTAAASREILESRAWPAP